MSNMEYGCEILLEKTTLEKAKNSSLPNDTYLIWYQEENEQHLDVVRGSRVNIFDMYYDKYGAEAIQRMEIGYGRVNSKLWGQMKTERKKNR